jgi:hypothetical protein
MPRAAGTGPVRRSRAARVWRRVLGAVVSRYGLFSSRMTSRTLAQRFTPRPLCSIIASIYAKEL